MAPVTWTATLETRASHPPSPTLAENLVRAQVVEWAMKLLRRLAEIVVRTIADAALRLAERLRGPDAVTVLTEQDIEIASDSAARRLENAFPELGFRKRRLPEASRRAGWVLVGSATIHGLGPPAHLLARRVNRRIPTGATDSFWVGR